MRLVKAHKGRLMGLLTPGASHPSQQLKKHADFSRRIRKGALGRNQLPSPIPGTGITKPPAW